MINPFSKHDPFSNQQSIKSNYAPKNAFQELQENPELKKSFQLYHLLRNIIAIKINLSLPKFPLRLKSLLSI